LPTEIGKGTSITLTWFSVTFLASIIIPVAKYHRLCTAKVAEIQNSLPLLSLLIGKKRKRNDENEKLPAGTTMETVEIRSNKGRARELAKMHWDFALDLERVFVDD